MRHHTHLALSEHEDIMVLRCEGKSVTEIAAITDRDKSTISRELSRNMCAKGKSLAGVTEGQVREVRGKLNRRPRKRLGYRIPYEAITQWCCN